MPDCTCALRAPFTDPLCPVHGFPDGLEPEEAMDYMEASMPETKLSTVIRFVEAHVELGHAQDARRAAERRYRDADSAFRLRWDEMTKQEQSYVNAHYELALVEREEPSNG